MRITITLLAATAVALVLTHDPERAEACSCRPPPPAQESFEEAQAVFIGVPQAFERGEGLRVQVPMKVERAYKGVREATVDIGTARDSAACGYPFEVGQPYLVYAYGDADGLAVSLCSRTRPLDDAQDDVQAIEEITPGTEPHGQGLDAKPRPPQVDVDGRSTQEPPAEPVAGPPPQQVEPGTRGCGCGAAGGGAGAGLLAGLVLLALATSRRRRA
jgi:MYXO-CTERM domain-containing protein